MCVCLHVRVGVCMCVHVSVCVCTWQDKKGSGGKGGGGGGGAGCINVGGNRTKSVIIIFVSIIMSIILMCTILYFTAHFCNNLIFYFIMHVVLTLAVCYCTLFDCEPFTHVDFVCLSCATPTFFFEFNKYVLGWTFHWSWRTTDKALNRSFQTYEPSRTTKCGKGLGQGQVWTGDGAVSHLVQVREWEICSL